MWRQTIRCTVALVFAIGVLAAAATPVGSRYHTYVTVSLDGVEVSAPVIVQLSGQTSHFEEPGLYFLELTVQDLNADRFRLLVLISEHDGGPEVVRMDREVSSAEYIAVLSTGPYKSAEEFEVRLDGRRFP